jgi:ubiquinone/menaquinone biosynthesis C-methylase UbiE
MDDDLALLIELHLDAVRQGPGSDADTQLAIELSGLRGASDLRVADIGCGTGASTFVLARELDAEITAVDLLPDFLRELERRAGAEGIAERITTLAVPMDDLPFGNQSLDAIWSEGAIYNIGFEHGVRMWRRFLKPGGILAVSELSWLTAERPSELDEHWNREYPEVGTVSEKLAVLEANGYSPIGYFSLSEDSWLEHYYRPMQARFEPFLARHEGADAARAIVAAEQEEIALYERCSAFVSYGYYVARRLP